MADDSNPDAGNPYRAPEAALASLSGEARRPPVYTAIALFCWALGAFFSCLLGLIVYAISIRIGWSRVIHSPGVGPRAMLVSALVVLCILSYLAAGRLLWVGRGRPGLILCVFAIATTYLAYAVYLSFPPSNRPRRPVSGFQLHSLGGSTPDRPFLPDHA